MAQPPRLTVLARERTLDAGFDEADVGFTRVAGGTTVEEFKEGIVGVVAGGPFPDFIEGTVGLAAGAAGESTQSVVLEAGSYIAWSMPDTGDDEESAEGEEPAEGEGGEEESGPSPEDVVLEAGHTYAAVCFISDLTRGPPHAFAHDMSVVFSID